MKALIFAFVALAGSGVTLIGTSVFSKTELASTTQPVAPKSDFAAETFEMSKNCLPCTAIQRWQTSSFKYFLLTGNGKIIDGIVPLDYARIEWVAKDELQASPVAFFMGCPLVFPRENPIAGNWKPFVPSESFPSPPGVHRDPGTEYMSLENIEKLVYVPEEGRWSKRNIVEWRQYSFVYKAVPKEIGRVYGPDIAQAMCYRQRELAEMAK